MTNQTDELLPCPFCGGEARLENCVIDASVRCEECRASITRKHARVRDTGIKASVTAWNTRATPTEPTP